MYEQDDIVEIWVTPGLWTGVSFSDGFSAFSDEPTKMYNEDWGVSYI